MRALLSLTRRRLQSLPLGSWPLQSLASEVAPPLRIATQTLYEGASTPSLHLGLSFHLIVRSNWFTTGSVAVVGSLGFRRGCSRSWAGGGLLRPRWARLKSRVLEVIRCLVSGCLLPCVRLVSNGWRSWLRSVVGFGVRGEQLSWTAEVRSTMGERCGWNLMAAVDVLGGGLNQRGVVSRRCRVPPVRRWLPSLLGFTWAWAFGLSCH